MANRRNIQFLYTPHNKATLLDCSFVVDKANGNGLGIRNLKGSGRIASVFMNTTAPLAGSGNPNPIAGFIQVNFQDNYQKYLGGFSGQVSPVSGSTNATTAGHVYVITALGTATLAQWQAAGLPLSVTPAVGVSFVAIATGIIGGAAAVMPPVASGSGIDHIEVIGDANLMNATVPSYLPAGLQINMVCFAGGVITAPADGTVIGMGFYFNDSYSGI